MENEKLRMSEAEMVIMILDVIDEERIQNGALEMSLKNGVVGSFMKRNSNGTLDAVDKAVLENFEEELKKAANELYKTQWGKISITFREGQAVDMKWETTHDLLAKINSKRKAIPYKKKVQNF